MKVITETRRTRCRLLQKHVVPDEGYYRNASYQMKVITETRRYQMKVITETGGYQMKVITETRGYQMKVITDTRRTHQVIYLRFPVF
jgi:hypothetical protein